MQFKKNGLRISEVPISCKYANSLGVETSSENSVTHGLGLVWSLVKLIVEERPLLFLGVPGMMFLVVGSLLGIWMFDVYTTTQMLQTTIVASSIGLIILGFFTLSTAVTLYAIARLPEKLKN